MNHSYDVQDRGRAYAALCFENLKKLCTFSKAGLGLYVHFPWCLQKCHYCDFYSLALEGAALQNKSLSAKVLDRYVKGIKDEFHLRLSDHSAFSSYQEVDSIYFGGGTPSLMPAQCIADLLYEFSCVFKLSKDCEISLEANPENLSKKYLEELYEAGITRVNVGLQSFEESILKGMNRYYQAERYREVLSVLAESRFAEGFGVDLIYGLPGQSAQSFYQDLAKVLDASPAHLSLYSLTVEQDTFYGRSVDQNKASAPDEGMQGEIWRALPETLASLSMRQYEVSNFALLSKRGLACSRHNLRYWLYEPYMGLGPGAHGFDGKLRYANPRSIQAYFHHTDSSYALHQALLDMPLLFLRITFPLSWSLWKEIFLEKCRFHPEILSRARDCIHRWQNKGEALFFCENGEDYFQWTRQGLNFLDDRILELHKALSAPMSEAHV